MRKTFIFSLFALLCAFGCTKEKKQKDRSEASDMFYRICMLTKEYTEKLNDAPDSSSWALACAEYEDKLDKISFSYPPDTDLLLTEGQNDTIHSLMLDYIKARDGRIKTILHPKVEVDSLSSVDSGIAIEMATEISREDASHSHGN